jgi:type IV pilus assembly protein PilF
MGDRAGAEASFRKATQLNPNNASALLQLAHVLYLNQDYFRASAFLQRLDGMGQFNADSLKLGYDIESHLGNRDAAQNYSKRLLSQFPDSEQAQALNSSVHP